MSDLAGSRNTMQVEECAFKGAVSESLLTRLAANTNLANLSYNKHSWQLQGSADFMNPANVGTMYLVDGPFIPYRKIEIVGLGIWMYGQGISGTLELDIVSFNTQGQTVTAGVSIFSTRPKYALSGSPLAGNICWTYDFVALAPIIDVTIGGGTVQTPVLSATEFTNLNWFGLNALTFPSKMFNLRVDLFYRVGA